MPLTLRVPDPDQHHAAVRLCSDLPLDPDEREFVRADGEWVLDLGHRRIERLEYELELVGADGATHVTGDAANPNEAPGVFGAKSVALAPGYAAPAWLDAPKAAGEVVPVEVAAREVGGRVDAQLWSPADTDGRELPMLVVHDGPEFDSLGRVTDYAAAMIEAGTLPPFRVALLAPPHDRNEWYSASAAYARALRHDILPSLYDQAPVSGRPVGMGASLGGLAMLHVQRRWLQTFDGLFLQSSSFFVPRHDRHESGFKRYERIVRFVRSVLRTDHFDYAVPTVLTCGAEEENVHNNRDMAAALARQGYVTVLHEVPDTHNYTGWRDAFDPYLTDLLGRLWRAS